MLFFNLFGATLHKYTEVSVPQAVSLINDKSPLILDIREPKERKSGYISKGKHISMAQIKSKMSSFSKTKPILVYCRSGTRSANIAQMLGKADFKAYNLKGGFSAWYKANMPITKK